MAAALVEIQQQMGTMHEHNRNLSTELGSANQQITALNQEVGNANQRAGVGRRLRGQAEGDGGDHPELDEQERWRERAEGREGVIS